MKSTSPICKNASSNIMSLVFKCVFGFMIYAIFVSKLTANANAENVIFQTPILSYPLASIIKSTPRATITNQDKIDLRKLLISRTHYQDSEINLEIGLHQISLNILNSRSNEISKKLRLQDATSIALILERAIKSDHQFSDVTAIHVSYMKVNDDKTTLIQAFDFYQTTAGAFIRNRN
jgi:hypothetical protein